MEKVVNLISTDHFSFKVSRQVAEIILHFDLAWGRGAGHTGSDGG